MKGGSAQQYSCKEERLKYIEDDFVYYAPYTTLNLVSI